MSSGGNTSTLYTEQIGNIRHRHYAPWMSQTLLDHVDTTPYPTDILEQWTYELYANCYMIPPSDSPSTQLAQQRVEETKLRVLDFFNADHDHYDVVFVSGCSAASKIIAEGFRATAVAETGAPGFWFGFHADSHNSIVGIREMTKTYLQRPFASDEEVEEWIKKDPPAPKTSPSLFAMSGQLDLTGRRLPWSWIQRIQESVNTRKTYVLVDAAILAATASIDLSDLETAPDFMTVSFGKIFGLPDLAALIFRKSASHILTNNRRNFGDIRPVHDIIMLDVAIRVHAKIFNSMGAVSAHTSSLAKDLHAGLHSLVYPTGGLLVRFLTAENNVGNPSVQGPVVAFNVVRSDGSVVPPQDVEDAARERRLSVRASGNRCVRVSLGAMSSFQDVGKLLGFLKATFLNGPAGAPLPPPPPPPPPPSPPPHPPMPVRHTPPALLSSREQQDRVAIATRELSVPGQRAVGAVVAAASEKDVLDVPTSSRAGPRSRRFARVWMALRPKRS